MYTLNGDNGTVRNCKAHLGFVAYCNNPTSHGGRGSRDVPAGKENLTWLYSQKAVRYGVVFEELIRQVAVHSERLATLVAKVSPPPPLS